MTHLFITDIDGCLSEPFKTPDWKLLTKIRELNKKSINQAEIPPLTICSGRPYPYVEAVAQWMGITLPVVFESAGILNVQNHQITTNGAFDEDAERKTQELKAWLKTEIIANEQGMVSEFSKRMDAGLVHPKKEVIQKVYPLIEEYVQANYADFEVHYTDVSINIVIKENNKRTGISDLCALLDVNVSETAYIGDSSGDIPGLKLVGRPFAPLNAAEEVKQVAQVVPYQSTKAVLEAYKLIIDENKKVLSD